ncbi:MAG: hypothetical protein K2X39_07500, partial [Silvanigrellaceae bacterium]|nr:hypothetical protein [Silvanigrellaceae bacterium]
FKTKKEFDDFSLYLHVPTRTDPSLAPQGGEVIYALVPVPNLASPTDWNTYKYEFTEKVKTFLEQNYLPGLREHIEVESIFTPLEFKHTLQSEMGNGFGLEPCLLQTAGFRPTNRSSEVKGLYFVGASTQPGAGLPGVLISSRITCSLIEQELNLTPPTEKLADLCRA